MTDSMNFGPDWIRNLPSEGSTGGGTAGGTKYQLAEFRYGREEMLALFDKSCKPPVSISQFKYLFSEATLIPLALLPASEDERGNGGGWQGRPNSLSGNPPRGRGGSLERGGRISRGRGYQYNRSSNYDAEQSDWSPRKEYNQRTMSVDNWRRPRVGEQEEDGWRGAGLGRSTSHEKWVRSTSWRGEGDTEEKSTLSERGTRTNWNDTTRAPPGRKSWDTDDHLPEWATENPTDGGGSFDDKGAFHGSDDEQLESKSTIKREIGLQKSVSQQHITRVQPNALSSSKSTTSLMKSEDASNKKKEQESKEQTEDTPQNKKQIESDVVNEKNKIAPNIPEKNDKHDVEKDVVKSGAPVKSSEKHTAIVNGPVTDSLKNEDSEFERLQEDLVLKLMGDEETPKPVPSNFEVSGVPPPPNLITQQLPIQDRWFYQDPQGQMQGPFSNLEMAEWYKAGYFSNQLKVRRYCDERFFMLGELIAMCGGNPFQSSMCFPVLKNDVTKMPDADILQFQYFSQLAAYKQAQARVMQEPWSALTLQQQELTAQRLIMQQQQVPQDLQFMQQTQAANPLMHMISQMQQANKLPGQGLVDKPPQTIPPTLDPHLQLRMGNLLSMQNRLSTNNLPAGLTGNLTSSLTPENLSSSLPNLQAGLSNLQTGLPNLPGSMPPVSNVNLSRSTTHSTVDQINSTQDNDPISSLLKQLQQQQKQQQQPTQLDSLWQQNQFSIPSPSSVPLTNHWQSQQNEIPSSMWDVQQNTTTTSAPAIPVSTIEMEMTKSQELEKKMQQQQKQKQEKEKKDELTSSEKKKKKELEEKQSKKEAEEKRKQEQRKQELEKKAAEEKRKKEEERIKKEHEKAKKDAEEKRLRELEEKRRLKEQRKAEEEAKKKQEELRKLEDERLRLEINEAEARRQAEEKRLHQEHLRIAKVAPWSHSNSTLGMSLAEIQKAEREKRAQDAAVQLQKIQEREIQSQFLQQQEKVAGIQLNWAKKPVEPRKVKSLAEIQAEEQEMLAKQAAEVRLQKEREKEILPVVNTSSSIWSSQNINWGNPALNSQWSSNSGGFWDDSSNRQPIQKPSSVTKSNSTNNVNVSAKQQQQSLQQQHQPQLQQKAQQTKTKTKKEENNKTNNNNNNGPLDEFTNWCYKTLSNMSSDVDIPTFVTFLRELESAYDVKEYCKEYLGESNATHQFACNFLEKRRSVKPKNNAHKDDMCSPAPAITPSLQHSTEFQEVKGKNKKNKKSKMLKVDSRILGFNVTSAPDRINVGDRDYGDNS